MVTRSSHLLGTVVLLGAVATGCATTTPTTPPTTPTTLEPSGPTWPDPPADRPVVELALEVAEDLASATGTERVSFTPGARVCEVVFRAWPNKPFTAATGNALTVLDATVDGAEVTVRTEPGGAPPDSPGTLVTLPLAECTAAGQTLDVELSFSVELGEGTDERIGYSAREEVAWLGTAYPLLAWDGAGWALDDAVPVPGETTTSTAFELASLVVRAPSRFEVTGVGAPAPAVQRADGTTEHRFSAPVVRDVTVTVGELDLVRESADGLTVVVAVPAGGSRAPATEWAQEVLDAAADLSDHFGPVPYDELWVSVLPGVTDGVEYSGAIQFGDVDPRGERWLLVHEVAHQWFYGLVGNNQARDPWMDEAFANYAEHLVSGDDDPTEDAVGVPGAVGRPMEFFADRRQPGRTYVDTVYLDGGRALVQARRAVDPDAFDEAVRRYLAENAHAVASPDDLVDALAGLPVAVQVLRDRGALPPEGR
ncbi:M1 family aminopeptidase [Ornithinimicrobium sp. W1665]|uniref:M1 family aminopeptidase n=1 Tax=Ornithinimicrobium sp. W1665 TaxID=3416666 RepID=UPI003CEE6A6F